MIQGNPTNWLSRLQDVEERIMGRVAAIWPSCTEHISETDFEDHITRVLVRRLQRDKKTRTIGYPDRKELLEDEPHLGDVRGEIDFAVSLGGEPEVYLSVECKVMNTLKYGSRHSLAGTYVEDGLMRYVLEQYADFLPVGAMLGYVLDGDTSFAKSQIVKALEKREYMVRPVPESGVTDLPDIDIIRRFSTRHLRSRGGDIEVRHSLLPYSSS